MQAVAPPFTKSFPPPRDKDTLAAYITEAAMIEQQFMCQYLYAAFSLKKQPDATCSPAQLEFVRRWASQIYMIARQEMEHLSIANSLLTAIGHAPWFGHDNFPTQSRWYTTEALKKKNVGLNAAPEAMRLSVPAPGFRPASGETFLLHGKPDAELCAAAGSGECDRLVLRAGRMRMRAQIARVA